MDNLGWAELAVLGCIALFVVGPERLPALAADLGKGLRRLRQTLRGVERDLRSELGPEVGDLDLRSLHPRELVRRHLLEDDEPLADDGRFAQDVLAPYPAVRPLAAGEPAPYDPEAT